MTRISFIQPAGPGSVFAPTAFDSQIGKVIPVNVDGAGGYVNGRVVAARVSEDGREVELTLEVGPVTTLPSLR